MTRDDLIKLINYELSEEMSGKKLNKILRSIPEIKNYGYEYGVSDNNTFYNNGYDLAYGRQPVYKVYIDFIEEYHNPTEVFRHQTGNTIGYYKETIAKKHDMTIIVDRKITERTFDRY